MPLPEEYYNILNTGAQSGISTFPGLSIDQNAQEQYPGMFFEPEEPRDFGSIADLAAGLGKGVVSGVTWSAVDMMDKDWEEMNTMDRTGWILGEGLSLFLPVGPFGLLSKAGRVATRGIGNNFVKTLAKNAGKLTHADANAALTGIANVAKKTGIKPEKIIRGLDTEVQAALRRITKDDLGIAWINQLSVGGAEAANAQVLLRSASANAVMDGFAKRGITNVTTQQANKISDIFVKGLNDGKYVNDVAEWMERGLGSRLPDSVNKYLGMAAQDMVMLGIHGLGVGKVGEHFHGTEFDPTESLTHSAMMSLAFPLIRRIPLGGDASISQGLKAYWRSYAGTDYAKLSAKYGDGTVRSMLSVMSRGGKFDLLNTSTLQRSWKVAGRAKEYTMNDIERSLFNADPVRQMPMGHVYSILGQMKKTVGKELRRNWGGKWLVDLAQSSPRMGIGVIAMNATVFKSGAFKEMDGPELASHMLMSALMTKGRGAWGRDTQRAFLADMTPYYEALDIMGVRPDVLQDRIRMYVGKDMQHVVGASFATDPTGMAIEQTFDTILSGAKGKPDIGFNADSHKIVQDASHIYNSIKRMKDSEHVILNTRNLPKSQLDDLAVALGKVEVEPGKTINEVGWKSALVKLTERPAESIVDLYGRMLESIGEKHGISVTYDPKATGRKISGEIVIGAESAGVITYNTILERLEGLGKATIRQRGNMAGIDSRDLRGGNPDEISNSIHRITEDYMDLMDAEHGGKKIYNNPRDNDYLDFIGRAAHISTKEWIYNVMNYGKDVEASNMAASMDNIFKVQDQGGDRGKHYLEDIGDYKIADAKNEGEASVKADALLDIEPLFNLMQHTRGVTQRPDLESQPTITIEQLTNVSNTFKERFKRMPMKYREDFFNQSIGEFVSRAMGSKETDRRAIATLRAGRDAGLIVVSKGKVQLMSNRQVQFLEGGGPKGSKRWEADVAETKKNLDIIAGALGPHVERTEWFPVDTADAQYHTITMKDIAKVAREVGNSSIKDLLKNGLNAVNEIQFSNDVLQTKLDDIKVQLENAVDMRTGDLKMKTIDDIYPQIETLLKLGVETNDVAELQTVLIAMRNFAGRGERDKAYFEDLTQNVNSLNDTISKIMNEEIMAKREPQAVVNKLINLTIKGKHGGGLSTGQAMELVEQANTELYKLMKTKGEQKVEFSEMIRDFNEDGGSWKQASDIIRNLNQQIVGQVLSQSRNPLFRTKALKMWEDSYERNIIHHKQRNLQSIAQDYGLMEPGEPNQINKAFIKRLVDPTDPYSVRRAVDEIREQIYTDNNITEASRLWKDFIEKDSNILISGILNGRVRSTAALKSGLLTFNPEGKFRSTPNDDFVDRTHINGHDRDPYKVHFLDDSMAIKGVVKNKAFSIDSFAGGDPQKIQDHINRSMRVSELQPDVKARLLSYGAKFTRDDLLDLTTLPTSPLVFMRLSPGMRILFDVSQKNIDKMNSDFTDWLANKEAYLRTYKEAENPGITDKFVELFKPQVEGQETDTKMRLKMLAMHLDYTKTGAFNSWMKEISKAKVDFSELARIESNLYKRGFLSDGGTTQRINKKLTDWNAENHTDPVVRAFARELRDNLDNKYTAGLISDESFQGITNSGRDRNGSPFDNRRVVSKNLRNIRADPNVKTGDIIDQLINRQVFDVENGRYESLETSILDGAKIVDEKLARTLWANKGGMGEWNGAKTVMFSTGDNSMVGKGFAVYIPEVSRLMRTMNRGQGIHMLIGQSSAKAWEAFGLRGNPLEAYDMKVTEAMGDQWIDQLVRGMGRNNFTQLDMSDIGVQFTSKNVDGVHISSSLVDWQSPHLIQKATDWMGIERLVNERGNIKSFIGQGNDLIHAVFNAREQEGQVFTEGAMGLIRKMVDMGVSGQNPLVRGQLDKMLRNEDYKMFSKIPNMFGQENFIVPDLLGNLSTPVFAEIVRKGTASRLSHIGVTSAADKQEGLSKWWEHDALEKRVAIQYGGIGISRHTASMKYGGKNITDRPFVFRDEHGVDHVVEWGTLTGKKEAQYNFFSQFYDTWDPYSKGEHERATHHLGNDTENLSSAIDLTNSAFDKKMVTSKVFKTKVTKVLDEVSQLIRDHNLDIRQVSRLLDGAQVSADNGSGGRVNIRLGTKEFKKGLRTGNWLKFDKYQEVLLELKGAVGASNNAIPKVNKDQPVMRVDAIDGNVMNGTVRVNAYDLRTTLQRDFDGDHLYTYFDMPFEMVRDFAKDMGHKPDYEMLEKSMSQKEANIFGLGTGKNGEHLLGQDESAIGFSKYANSIKSAKIAVGAIIGARKSMSWLANADFKVWDKKANKGKGDYVPFLKDFISKKALWDEDMQVLNRMMDVAQNSVDMFGGQNRVMLRDALENYYFFGDMPANYEAPEGSLESMHSRGSVFSNREFGRGPNRELERTMFKIVLRTLAKANRMSNDLWDEAGSRAPHVWELKRDHRNLKALFTDPTNFLIGELSRQVGWMSRSADKETSDMGKQIRDQMVTHFFGKMADDVRNRRQINDLHKEIATGEARAQLYKKYRFDYQGEKFGLSVGGKVLDEVMKKQIYNDTEGMADLDVSKHTRAGFIVSNLLDRVAISRMFQVDPVKSYKEFTLEGVSMETIENSKAGTIKNSITKGHVRNILQKEYRQTSGSLRWFNEERFTNPMKLEGLIDRLGNISDAIRIIDKQVAEEMVIDRKNYEMVKNYGKKAKKRSGKMTMPAFVYEIKGEIRKKKGVKTERLIDWETKDNIELDYGKLKPYRYVQKGERFKMRIGSTYLVDRAPMMRESASKVEAEYSEAWKQVTAVGRIDSRTLTSDEVVAETFRLSTDRLRKQVDGSYYDAIGDVKFDRVFGKQIHKHAAEMEINMIDNFMRQWSKQMTGTEKDPERIGLLMRYVLQPQIMTGKYVSDGNMELPFYRSSKRLQMQVFNWAIDHGYEPIVKDMITKVEQRYRGERYEEDLNLTGYKKIHKDGYRWEELGDMADIVKSLSSGWFTSPFLIDIEGKHNLVPNEYRDMQSVRTLGGGKMIVKQMAPRAYDEKGCVF